MSLWLATLLAVGLVLALASAAFSAVETAIFSMSQERRRRLRARDPRRADMLEGFLLRSDEVANALLLANTLTNIPLFVLLLVLVDELGLAEDLSSWGLLVLVFLVVVAVCDLLPKLAALSAPVRTTRLSLPLVRRLLPLLEPITGFLARVTDRLTRRFAPKSSLAGKPLSPEELETMVAVGREEGTFTKAEAGLLHEILKLGGESARHCMTPRVDAYTLPDDLTNAEAARRVRNKRYRFVPVRGESADDVLGLLDVREFLLHPSASHYTERLQPPSFVPETIGAFELLQSFLRHRQHLAILLDEYGGIEGLVTLSDIVEELLGEEGPAAGNELYIERLGRGRLLAAGGAGLDDIAEEIGMAFADGDVETVGGLLVRHFGNVPPPGESFTSNGWRFTVRRATRKRVREVLIERVDGAMAGEDRA